MTNEEHVKDAKAVALRAQQIARLLRAHQIPVTDEITTEALIHMGVFSSLTLGKDLAMFIRYVVTIWALNERQMKQDRAQAIKSTLERMHLETWEPPATH